MSLQTDDALRVELDEIDELATERGLPFNQAARAYWFGIRPADGRTINPLILDMSRSSLEIARELNAQARGIMARLAA